MEKTPKSKRKQIIQLLVLLLCFFGIRMILKSYEVQGPLLEPYLKSGDRVLMESISPRLAAIHTGDIILCHLPSMPGNDHIKRVVGAPGDVIEVHDHKIWVNGTEVPNSFTSEEDQPQAEIVPEHQYFVLDVNLTAAQVQNHLPVHGLVPLGDIRARLLWRYWPFSRS